MEPIRLQIFFDELITKVSSERNFSKLFSIGFLPRQQIQTNWYALTGPPCSGKTTVLNELEKIGFPVIAERGRFVVESALEAGFTTREIFDSQQLLQETILKAKIIAHLDNPKERLTILEDGIPESLAYFRSEKLDISGINHIFDRFRYRKIFYLDALPLLNDPARPHSQEKVDRLGEIKRLVHIEMGYEVVFIPVFPVGERVAMIRNMLLSNA